MPKADDLAAMSGVVEAVEALPNDGEPVRRQASNLFDFVAQLGASVVGRGLYLVLQMVLARSLGPEGFGLYAIGWAAVALISTVTPVGMPQAALRFRLGGRSSLASNAMIVTVCVGVVAGLVLFFLADVIAKHMFGASAAGPVIRAFASAVPLFGVLSLVTSALRTGGAMAFSAIVGALTSVVYLALVAAVFIGTPSPVLAANLYALALAVAILPAVVSLLRARNIGELAPPLGSLMRFGIITMFIHSANVLNLSVDRVIVGVMADPVAVGVYQIASQLAMAGLMLRNAIEVVFESSVARIGTKHGVPDVSREFYVAWRLVLHASGPGLIVLAFTAGVWVQLLFGQLYSMATTPLIILATGQILATLAGPSLACLHMSGAERTVLRLTISSAVLNIALCFALIPFLGSSGAALASVVANLAVSGISLGYCLCTGRVRFSTNQVRDVLIGMITCVASTLLATRWWGELNLYKAAAVLMFAYLVYAVTIVVFCTTDDELINAVTRRLGLRSTRRVGG